MLSTDSLTVAVDGHLEPVTRPVLEALDVLWETVRQLPISEYELKAMGWLLASGNTADLERMMDGNGVVDWPLGLDGGGQATVRVWHGDGLTHAQRVAARYSVVQLEADTLGRRMWAIHNVVSGALVSSGRHPLRFSTPESAGEWIRSRVNLAGYRSTRHLAGTE
ncbi:hypothetical protein [Kitasatospora cathayae]|uniref:DUF317 domain-containing protein n=1 Tax=Kitasatospora cathayae TaxID=3004092 RepID=A0ABY7QAU5_9ACTN|nr:hypothetical protein [Kitasatospora sp. HUAS 3-15]WBP89554.1 hypothetical protein O1G21_29395 [Kitasatospora sp. HUAS 3-15]